ncbi:MAG: glutamine--fructose-6-phosphate aminotransferase [Omnitrophica WOR_2 bacterium GWF2_38_59]|nr:MAG: glutamine--fructose-6-phosphate aminotransferase [Omnitrophica WOR_2 bacterium GWF2_38_59]OGX50286.1 MAG: glutamine--fructose-6-phosphate aminotransferase [Omnitrophica WOR_2 bacterium RIFOXYA2_FULL_38_17]OGX58924.1 MAG: glutamine--fructose-6-phosphate aminotransferase [Omnitrophica WOR_2 bacterium RIFOXYC2_FULL_38_12]OGX60533.1 MAG: glutamine--fructose-6-phosphate aminotransferase [Omnitrophica WOR_2 bacterium RIFOXYB2_FULL_38_16]HBG62080.1 glutamine--fructose-6-phosphate transaminase 
MCGIIGYIGSKQAIPVLLDGLKKLEYRGYDSSGVGIVCSSTHKLDLRKMHGKIHNLEKLIKDKPVGQSSVGISHTRWATHGAPNKVNAHPHFDCSKKILVVHNGIIENYEDLKRTLIQKGHKFVSETDTEVISHLIEQNYNGDIFEAVKKGIRHLRGAFALGVICSDDPEKLVAARVGSPLIVGIGNGENFIASDVPAIIDKTKKIIYLKDGEIATITRQEVLVHTFAGKQVKPKVNIVKFDVDAVKKQGYAHFMLKEIHEQPEVLAKIIKERIHGNRISLDGLKLTEKQLKAFKNIYIVACGTAYHAGLVGKYVIEKLASIPVSVDAASEFRYRDPIIDNKTLIIAISQSGETADTLAAVREARSKGAKIISICNVVGSSLSRDSDGILYTHAGPEIGVASTKAYIAQIAMLYLLALKLSSHTDKISERARLEIIKELKTIPSLYKDILKTKGLISKIAKKNSHFGCFLFLGRNINYPSALEGALKLKEISYIPAEGYAAGEMKHGPIALIDEYRAVVCIAVQSPTYEKMISNIQEIRARKGKIIAIATQGDQTIKKHSNHVVYVPRTLDLLTPLLVALPLQLFAYYVSVGLGCDVDQPRNLAKSVTVE